MFFSSGNYYLFLIITFFAFWLVASNRRARVLLLAAASYIFYAQAGLVPAALLLAITTSDYTIARLMERWPARRKLLLISALFIDIGTLAVFKYANFFIESVKDGLGTVGINVAIEPLNIIVPIGISFFIFQSLSYVIDVYRKDFQPTRSYWDYLAFVSFFPTIIAGPITRAKQLLPQLRERLTLDAETGGQALFLISLGLVKKIAIADYLRTNFVDRVFDFPDRFSAFEVLAAIYGYAIQIYADFSGYSDIALGSALLLGFKLSENFNSPYRAQDLPDFWRRWHISLSNWLRDYLFFSIAGLRARNALALYGGLVVTMLIGGLWHGATWTFVIWGFIHGLGLVCYRMYEQLRARSELLKSLRNSRWSEVVGILLTFHFVCLTWIFFRAETLGQATLMIKQLTTLTVDHTNLSTPVAILIALGFIAHWLPERLFETTRKSFIELPALGQAAVIFGLAIGLYFVASSDVVPFIYARF